MLSTTTRFLIGSALVALSLTGCAHAKPPTTLKPATNTDPVAAYLATLKAQNSGKGVFVFDPVPVAGAHGDFATGCARWLYLALGGTPEMPRTPPWLVLATRVEELGRTDLRLGPAEAQAASRPTGATHYLVGRSAPGKLTFQLHDRAGKPVGAEIVVQGSDPEIAAALPTVVAAVRARLGLPASAVAPPRESATELALLGRLPVFVGPESAEADVVTLRRVSDHSLLAGLMYLYSPPTCEPDPEDRAMVGRRLAAAAPSHPLVLEALARTRKVPEAGPALEAAAKAFPGAAVTIGRMMASTDRAQQLSLAESAVRAAPDTAETWTLLARRALDAANDVRRGRTADQIPPDMGPKLATFYLHALIAAAQAAERNPQSVRANLVLAEAATFAGARDLAEPAMARALALSERQMDADRVVRWALEMYHPKWGGSEAQLKQIVDRAAAWPTVRIYEAVAVLELLPGNCREQKVRLAERILPVADARLTTNPGDYFAHTARRSALGYLGRWPEAVSEAQRSVALRPREATERTVLVDTCRNAGNWEEARRAAQQFVQDFPNDAEAPLQLAMVCSGPLDLLPEAIAAGRIAAERAPRSTKALWVLGQALVKAGAHGEAARVYEKLVALSPNDLSCMLALAEEECAAGRVAEGRRWLRRVADDEGAPDYQRQRAAALLARYPGA